MDYALNYVPLLNINKGTHNKSSAIEQAG